MDTRVPADDAGWPAGPAPSRPDSVEHRLAAIERRLDHLERSLRESIALDLQAVGEDLRHTVSDLGRLLLRDLDRLTRVLAEHRDAIVDRLQPPAMPVAAPVAFDDLTTTPVPPPETSPAGEGIDGPGEAGGHLGEEGRWYVVPGRRRRKDRRPGNATAPPPDE